MAGRLHAIAPRRVAADHSQGLIALVDVREADEFATGAVPGSVCLPLTELRERLDDLPVERPVVFVCRTGRRSVTAAALARRNGLEAFYSLGGLREWRRARLPYAERPAAANGGPSGPSISPEEAWASRGDITLIDIRSVAAWEAGRVPGSRCVPLHCVSEQAPLLEEEGRTLVFLCRDGRRSAIASEMLQRRGRVPAAHVAGGLVAWLESDLPLERQARQGV